MFKKDNGKDKIIKDEIETIEYIGEKETYDLEVGHEEHSFFANDISVSNSHSVSYSIISYQCAYLFTYYPSEWVASFLDKETEKEGKREKSISLAQSFGYKIENLNINKSGTVWEISPDDDKILIQPLTSIKGLGMSAIEEILKYRPFNTIEEFLFHPEMIYRKVNKKSLHALILSGALSELMDDRFKHLRHFWLSVVNEKANAKTPEKFLEVIEKTKFEPDFTNEEMIDFITELTGIYPIDRILTYEVRKELKENYKVPPISEYSSELNEVWLIPKNIMLKKTKRGKDYYIIDAIDENSIITTIKCWGIDPRKDLLFKNRPYLATLQYSEEWGFSTRGAVNDYFKLLD